MTDLYDSIPTAGNGWLATSSTPPQLPDQTTILPSVVVVGGDSPLVEAGDWKANGSNSINYTAPFSEMAGRLVSHVDGQDPTPPIQMDWDALGHVYSPTVFPVHRNNSNALGSLKSFQEWYEENKPSGGGSSSISITQYDLGIIMNAIGNYISTLPYEYRWAVTGEWHLLEDVAGNPGSSDGGQEYEQVLGISESTATSFAASLGISTTASASGLIASVETTVSAEFKFEYAQESTWSDTQSTKQKYPVFTNEDDDWRGCYWQLIPVWHLMQRSQGSSTSGASIYSFQDDSKRFRASVFPKSTTFSV